MILEIKNYDFFDKLKKIILSQKISRFNLFYLKSYNNFLKLKYNFTILRI